MRGTMGGGPDDGENPRGNSDRSPEDEFEDEDGGIFMDDIAPTTSQAVGECIALQGYCRRVKGGMSIY